MIGQPPLPDDFTRGALERVGFAGWTRLGEIRATDLADVPCTAGVYVIYRPDTDPPVFLPISPAGWFQGQDPTEPVQRLKAEWVDGANVLNIGKADMRVHSRPVNALRERLGEYARFGAGAAVGHRGGRLIWQIAAADHLLVAWHEVTWDESARGYEKRLLAHFAALNGGRRPFTNLTG